MAVPTEGLRERKKARTRSTIQTEALRLFREQGYHETTVDDIIAAAEVSESTFYRYFPSKSEVVVLNDYQPRFLAALLAQPCEVSTLPAIRAALCSIANQLTEREQATIRERMVLAFHIPELRAALLDRIVGSMGQLRTIAARRAGCQRDEFAVRALAGAVVGLCVTVMSALAEDPSVSLATLLDQAMGYLETGFFAETRPAKEF